MSYIEFIEDKPNPKTKVWSVIAKKTLALLGKVKWLGCWRQYAFFPEPETMFEEDCLREIAAFCENQTRKRKEG